MALRTFLLLSAVGSLAVGQKRQRSAETQWQTAAGGKMAFEVASIKRSMPDSWRGPNFPLDPGDAYVAVRGRFSAVFPLSVYVQFAYKLSPSPEQLRSMLAHLPKWLETDNYDIEALAAGNPTKDQMRLMVQSLLADRFKLTAHFETQKVPVLALTLVKPGKLGLKLRAHTDGPACGPPADNIRAALAAGDPNVFPHICDVYSIQMMPGGIQLAGSRNTTMELLAAYLPSRGNLGRPVIDRTGLSGRFDFTLEWTPEPDISPDGGVRIIEEGRVTPRKRRCLRAQHGLRLTGHAGVNASRSATRTTGAKTRISKGCGSNARDRSRRAPIGELARVVARR